MYKTESITPLPKTINTPIKDPIGMGWRKGLTPVCRGCLSDVGFDVLKKSNNYESAQEKILCQCRMCGFKTMLVSEPGKVYFSDICQKCDSSNSKPITGPRETIPLECLDCGYVGLLFTCEQNQAMFNMLIAGSTVHYKKESPDDH